MAHPPQPLVDRCVAVAEAPEAELVSLRVDGFCEMKSTTPDLKKIKTITDYFMLILKI